MRVTRSVSDVKKNIAEIVNMTCYTKERFVISKYGKDCAAIIPITDLEILERIEDLFDIRDAEAAIKEAEEKGGIISFEQFRKEIGVDN